MVSKYRSVLAVPGAARLFATALVALASPAVAVALSGAVGLAGTLLFLRSPLLRASEPGAIARSERRSALASPELRALLGPVALTGAALGATEVGLPSLALHAG